MVSPETDGGYGEKDMLARFEGPGTGKAESYTHRITW